MDDTVSFVLRQPLPGSTPPFFYQPSPATKAKISAACASRNSATAVAPSWFGALAVPTTTTGHCGPVGEH